MTITDERLAELIEDTDKFLLYADISDKAAAFERDTVTALRELQQLRERIAEVEAALEAEKARFRDHLDAWKQNNAWHAARIRELEAAVQFGEREG